MQTYQDSARPAITTPRFNPVFHTSKASSVEPVSNFSTQYNNQYSQKFKELQIEDSGSTSSKFSNKIKYIMDHVSKTLSRLLENLNYLYETNGIQFKVDDLHKTLIRLLTPHQLMNQFHMVDSKEYFKNQQKYSIPQCKYKEKFDWLEFTIARQQKRFNESLPKIYEQQGGKSTLINLSPTPTVIPKSPLNSPEINQNLKKSQTQAISQSIQAPQVPQVAQKVEKTYQGSKSLLGQNVQLQVARWVLQELRENRCLKMKDIAEKTKEIAYRFKGFKSSIGWVNRFLTRHPYLKIMMKYCKEKNYSGVRDVYNKVKKTIDSDNFDDVKAFNKQWKGIYAEQMMEYPEVDSSEKNGQIKEESEESDSLFSSEELEDLKEVKKNQKMKLS